jgi:hypothetical protein
MSRSMWLLGLGALLSSGSAYGGDPIRSAGNFGLGLGGGSATSGISAKYFMADHHALQGVVGTWGLGRSGYGTGLGVSVDYLFEMPAITDTDPLELGWNLGLGGWFATAGGGTALGAQGVAGLEFAFHPVPIDVVIEYRPGLIIVPGVGADLINFSGHVRYYF